MSDNPLYGTDPIAVDDIPDPWPKKGPLEITIGRSNLGNTPDVVEPSPISPTQPPMPVAPPTGVFGFDGKSQEVATTDDAGRMYNKAGDLLATPPKKSGFGASVDDLLEMWDRGDVVAGVGLSSIPRIEDPASKKFWVNPKRADFSGLPEVPYRATGGPAFTGADVAKMSASTAVMMGPLGGIADYWGLVPTGYGGNYSSFSQNVDEENYVDAALQIVGVGGDVLVTVPIIGAALSAGLKAPRAMRAAAQAEELVRRLVNTAKAMDLPPPVASLSLKAPKDGVLTHPISAYGAEVQRAFEEAYQPYLDGLVPDPFSANARLPTDLPSITARATGEGLTPGTHGTVSGVPFDVTDLKIADNDVGIHFGNTGQSHDRMAQLRGGYSEYPEGSRVMAAYLDIKNPISLPDLQAWTAPRFADRLLNDYPEIFTKQELGELRTGEDVRELLKSKGYDGIVYENLGEYTHESALAREEFSEIDFALEAIDRKLFHRKPLTEEEKAFKATADDRLAELTRTINDINEDALVNGGKDSYIVFDPEQVIPIDNVFDPNDPYGLFRKEWLVDIKTGELVRNPVYKPELTPAAMSISMEAAPGSGGPWRAKYGDRYFKLSLPAQAAVNRRVVSKAMDEAAKLLGMKRPDLVTALGGWEGQLNASGVARIVLNDVQGEAFARTLAVLLGQNEVWINKIVPLAKAEALAVDIMEVGSKTIRDEAKMLEVWNTIRAADGGEGGSKLIVGFQPIRKPDGSIGFRILVEADDLVEAADNLQKSLDGPISEALAAIGDFRAKTYGSKIEKVVNDLKGDPHGQLQKRRLRDLGFGRSDADWDNAVKSVGEEYETGITKAETRSGGEAEAYRRASLGYSGANATPIRREDGKVDFSHWSYRDGISELDPVWAGSNPNIRGAERQRPNRPQAVYVGLDAGRPGGYVAESGLGTNHYRGALDPGDIYNGGEDPLELYALAKYERPNDAHSRFEELVVENGFKGYWINTHFGPVAAIYEKLPVEFSGTADRLPMARGVTQKGRTGRPLKSEPVKINPNSGAIADKVFKAAAKKAGIEVLDPAKSYPPPTPPRLYDKSTKRAISGPIENWRSQPAPPGTYYGMGDKSPEAKAISKEANRVQRAMDAGTHEYEPVFKVSDRFDVDPKKYPTNQSTQTVGKKGVDPSFREEAAKGRAALKKYFDVGVANEDTADWYLLGQLEKSFIDELGEEAGRQAFQQKIVEAMAATTSGADPTANFRTAMYGNFQRALGEKALAPAHQLPYPVGGRYIGGNLENYDKLVGTGKMTAKSQPKMNNFSRNMFGEVDPGTVDKQMSEMMGYTGSGMRGGRYAAFEAELADLAKEMGITTRRLQEIAWAGYKMSKDPSFIPKPMIRIVNEAIERTSQVTGLSPEVVLKEAVIYSRMPLYSAAGAAMLLPGIMMDAMEDWEGQWGFGTETVDGLPEGLL